jgi:hypothetical protein
MGEDVGSTKVFIEAGGLPEEPKRVMAMVLLRARRLVQAL